MWKAAFCLPAQIFSHFQDKNFPVMAKYSPSLSSSVVLPSFFSFIYMYFTPSSFSPPSPHLPTSFHSYSPLHLSFPSISLLSSPLLFLLFLYPIFPPPHSPNPFPHLPLSPLLSLVSRPLVLGTRLSIPSPSPPLPFLFPPSPLLFSLPHHTLLQPSHLLCCSMSTLNQSPSSSLG